MQGGRWMWSAKAEGYEAYKNDILTRYQVAITQCGIPKKDQKVFVMQPMQENGALDPTLTGGTDHGYSFGIGQWNVAPYKAKTWLKRHPEQKSLTWQINALAAAACDHYKQFSGNTWQAIVAHNCPTCALIKPGHVIGGHGYSYWHAVGMKYWNAVNKHDRQLVYL